LEGVYRELLQYEDPSGKRLAEHAKKMERQRQEGGGGDGVSQAQRSRRRVNDFLQTPRLQIPAACHRALSDIFMVAVTGHKFGGHKAKFEAKTSIGSTSITTDASTAQGPSGTQQTRREARESKEGGGTRRSMPRGQQQQQQQQQPSKQVAAQAEKARRQLHIDTAKMDHDAWLRLIMGLVCESVHASPTLHNLSDRMWLDATRNLSFTPADGQQSAATQADRTDGRRLSFQDVCRYFSTVVTDSFEVRAAFMFDMYDKDDDGGITLKELSDLIHNCQPGSLVEQDLIAFSRGRPVGGNKKEFFFDDYLDAMEGALEAGGMGMVEKICSTLGLPPCRPRNAKTRGPFLVIRRGQPNANTPNPSSIAPAVTGAPAAVTTPPATPAAGSSLPPLNRRGSSRKNVVLAS